MKGVDPNLRAQVRAWTEQNYGEHTFLPGNRIPPPRRLPTGSLALDHVSGGGYPFGHMTRFWGSPSSGKTLAMFLAFVAAQNFGELRYSQLMNLAELCLQAGESKMAKAYKDQAKREREYASLSCLFVNAEKSIDVEHMRRVGIDMSKLDIINKSEIESVGEIVFELMPAYHVIGVDSTTACMSLDELSKNGDGIHGNYPMKRATRWGINMDWWRARMTPENLIMFTSHATQKTGVRTSIQGSTPEHPPGGTKLNHEPGLVLHFLKSSVLKRKSDGGLEEVGDAARGSATTSAFAKFEPAGGVLVAKCDKNKVGVQGRTAVLHHDKRTGSFDSLHEYEKFAAYYRVLAKNKAWWTLPDGSKTQQVRSTLEKDAALRARIEAVVLRCAEDPEYEASLLAGRTEALVALPSAASV